MSLNQESNYNINSKTKNNKEYKSLESSLSLSYQHKIEQAFKQLSNSCIDPFIVILYILLAKPPLDTNVDNFVRSVYKFTNNKIKPIKNKYSKLKTKEEKDKYLDSVRDEFFKDLNLSYNDKRTSTINY